MESGPAVLPVFGWTLMFECSFPSASMVVLLDQLDDLFVVVHRLVTGIFPQGVSYHYGEYLLRPPFT